MSAAIRDWSITALCLSMTAMLWLASSPERLGYFDAARDIAYESVWSEYITDCDCADPLE